MPPRPLKTKPTTVKRKKTTSRAKSGERLLLTCNKDMGEISMGIVADGLYGMMLPDTKGGYWQVVSVRLDVPNHKIYGTGQQMYEAAPYMFMPVPGEENDAKR